MFRRRERAQAGQRADPMYRTGALLMRGEGDADTAPFEPVLRKLGSPKTEHGVK